ncbi:siderophore-iron reductase FhuF [Bosea sp. BIWAKO-01]|uniref:siderophore-iron reductase FhuF n=1 Tax=Bosea sp. BIWAKO-01 TaxID=506668 RepID=UPI0008529A38|nr:siderophore-iron reductase FhuF [Bosea sp. BIWAKO-01]GAU85571.1 ferric reductase [Bosea sp. BIWAKO-01]
MTIPVFAPLFSGELAPYGDRFVLAADAPAPSPGRDLGDATRLAELLALYSRQCPGGDRRAIASLWSKQHFATLLPPYLAFALMAQRAVDIDLAAIGCTFGPDGTTRHIHLHGIGSNAIPADEGPRFMPLIQGHIEPMVLALSAAAGISRKVVWSNAGNMFEFVLRRIERAIGVNDAVAEALSFLESARLPNGKPNPLFKPVSYADPADGSGRQRRVCCIRYLVPGRSYCSTCPLPAARAAAG